MFPPSRTGLMGTGFGVNRGDYTHFTQTSQQLTQMRLDINGEITRFL